MVFKQGIVVGTQAGWRSRAENNVTKHPADRRTIRRAATHGKSDDPTRVLVHHNHHPMRPEDQRLTAEQIDAPETVLAVAGKCQPGWTVGARIRPAVLGQHAPHQVFVHGAPVAAGSGFDVLVAGVVGRAGGGPSDWRVETVWAGHCQVNRNPLFFDAKSIRANTTNQRLRWHVDQWNLQEIS